MNKRQYQGALIGLLVIVLVSIAMQILYFGSEVAWVFFFVLIVAYVASRVLQKKAKSLR
ncbi:MAG: hypothetical protein KKA90_00835 [Nanoarchaeota archaeon]|nr:hypothetical protein [Nanoarchaeota archaeon]